MSRRSFLRGLAALPAAIKHASSSGLVNVPSSPSPLGMAYPGIGQPSVPDPIIENAQRQIRRLDSLYERLLLGSVNGIPLSIYAIRSYSDVYRAIKHQEMIDAHRAATRPFRVALNWIDPNEEDFQ